MLNYLYLRNINSWYRNCCVVLWTFCGNCRSASWRAVSMAAVDWNVSAGVWRRAVNFCGVDAPVTGAHQCNTLTMWHNLMLISPHGVGSDLEGFKISVHNIQQACWSCVQWFSFAHWLWPVGVASLYLPACSLVLQRIERMTEAVVAVVTK